MKKYNKLKKILKPLNNQLQVWNKNILYHQLIDPDTIYNALYNNYRKIFLPYFPLLRIALLSAYLAITYANIVNRLSEHTFNGIKTHNLITIAVVIICLILEVSCMFKSKKWRQKLWDISLKETLLVLKVKNEKSCFELISILEKRKQEITLSKQQKKDSHRTTFINLTLTIMTGFFTFSSALLKENYVNFIIKNLHSTIYYVINICMPIIATIVALYFIYKITENSFMFNEEAKISLIISKLYDFNYKENKKRNLEKNMQNKQTK